MGPRGGRGPPGWRGGGAAPGGGHGGETYSHNEKLIRASGVSVVFVFFLTNIASVLFSAVAFACAAIAIHGSMRVPDNLFVDETPQGAQGAGLFGGLFGGAAPAVLASTV